MHCFTSRFIASLLSAAVIPTHALTHAGAQQAAAVPVTPSPALAGPASVLSKAVRTSATMEPAVPHAEQDKSVAARLAAWQSASGKKPNIVWMIVDDMGYGDPGCFGGGAAIGAATPNIDALAQSGLKLTACYSQPTCTPTRSAILTGRLPVRTGLTRPILTGDKLT